jgi:hypothetical protein
MAGKYHHVHPTPRNYLAGETKRDRIGDPNGLDLWATVDSAHCFFVYIAIEFIQVKSRRIFS